LQQGILKNYVFVTVLICALIDACLIICGVMGFGKLISSNVYLLNLAKWGGIVFLSYYGFRSFRSVFTSHAMDIDRSQDKPLLKSIILMALTFSLLNPHVYLDTVVLIGSISAQFPSEMQNSFAYGAICASFLWFFLLGYGARFLAPLFKNPLSWKILDFIIGIIMWAIAISLLRLGEAGA